MSKPMTYDDHVRIYKAEGLVVREVPGGRGRCRCCPDNVAHRPNGPWIRGWGDIVGQVAHITAGGLGNRSVPQYINDIINGDPAVPCKSQTVIAPNGEVWVNSSGRCNHAGTVGSQVKARMKAADFSTTDNFDNRFTGGSVDGNAFTYGDECIAAKSMTDDGDQDDMPDDQYDALVRVHAARARFHGWSGQESAGHGEISNKRGEGDPNLHVGKFRRAVMARVKAGPGGPVQPPVEPPVEPEPPTVVTWIPREDEYRVDISLPVYGRKAPNVDAEKVVGPLAIGSIIYATHITPMSDGEWVKSKYGTCFKVSSLTLIVDEPVPPVISDPEATRYTVTAGDTLNSIAARHGISLAELLRLNGFDVIEPGQTLIVGSTVPPLDPEPDPVPDPQPEPEPEPEPPAPVPTHQTVTVLSINAASKNATVIKKFGAWTYRVLLCAKLILDLLPDFVVLQECYSKERPLLDRAIDAKYTREAVREGRVIYKRKDLAATGIGGSIWTDILPGTGTKFAVARKYKFDSGAILNLANAHLSYETTAAGVAKRAKEVPAFVAWVRNKFPTGYDLYVGDFNAPFKSTTRKDDVGPVFAKYNLHDLGNDVNAKAGKGHYHLDRGFAGLVKAIKIRIISNEFTDHPAVHFTVKVPTK